MRTAGTVLHRELQLAGAFGSLEIKNVPDSNTSGLLNDLDRLVQSWPDKDVEGIESFRDALSNGTTLLTRNTHPLSFMVSQEDSILRFIGIYWSVVTTASVYQEIC